MAAATRVHHEHYQAFGRTDIVLAWEYPLGPLASLDLILIASFCLNRAWMLCCRYKPLGSCMVTFGVEEKEAFVLGLS